MRIANILTGQFRGADNPTIQESLRKNLCDISNPDIYLCVWNNRGESKWDRENHRPKRHSPDEEVTKALIEKTYPNVKRYAIHNYAEFMDKYKDSPEIQDPLNTVPQFFLMAQSLQLFNPAAYDLIIWSRPDFIYYRHLPPVVIQHPDKFWHINTGSSYYPERIYALWAASSPRNMAKFLNIFADRDEYWDIPSHNGLGRTDPCRILYKYMEKDCEIQSVPEVIGDIHRL